MSPNPKSSHKIKITFGRFGVTDGFETNNSADELTAECAIPFTTRAEYVATSLEETELIVSVVVSAPETLLPLLRSTPFFNQRYDNGAIPVAPTRYVALLPAATTCVLGCKLMVRSLTLNV